MSARRKNIQKTYLTEWRHARKKALNSAASRSSVHQFRIATRRLSAALMFLHGLSPNEARARLGRKVRRAFRASGQLRDLQVCLQLGRSFANDDAASQEMQRWMRRRLVGHRERFRKRLVRAKPGPLIRRLKRLGDETAVVDMASTCGRIDELEDKLRRRIKALPPDPDVALLHRIRVACKPLRYMAEIAAHESTSMQMRVRSRRALERLKNVQSSLGDLADARMWQEMIECFKRDTGTPARALSSLRRVAVRWQRKQVLAFATLDERR